jgi:hypothetical protein
MAKVIPADDAHPEDFCQRCGGRNPVWWVDSDRYNTAVNRAEIVCPTCFVFAHEEATGMRCVWTLVPDGPFRWIEDDGRPTPFLAPDSGSSQDPA